MYSFITKIWCQNFNRCNPCLIDHFEKKYLRFGISLAFSRVFWYRISKMVLVSQKAPLPELWRGKVCLFLENAFGKSAIIFHPLSRFCRNTAYFKGNWFRSQKIFWVLEFTVFSWNDVITKLKILITLLGAPELFLTYIV
jgi:hypothetical protein